jgi:hypothetical protein
MPCARSATRHCSQRSQGFSRKNRPRGVTNIETREYKVVTSVCACGGASGPVCRFASRNNPRLAPGMSDLCGHMFGGARRAVVLVGVGLGLRGGEADGDQNKGSALGSRRRETENAEGRVQEAARNAEWGVRSPSPMPAQAPPLAGRLKGPDISHAGGPPPEGGGCWRRRRRYR